MAEQGDNLDRTEEATPERREEFREKGQVAVSREITSVFVLASMVGFITIFGSMMTVDLEKLLTVQFQALKKTSFSSNAFLSYTRDMWSQWIYMILPMFILASVVAAFSTLMQTRFNWSWKKLNPDFKRLNPGAGLKRMVTWQAVVELLKGCGKMLAIGTVGYLIIYSELPVIPGLLNVSIEYVWAYWGEITALLFWSVAGLMVLIAGLDFAYNFISMENRLKMTKQEVKEEAKKREVDPHIRARIRRIQREMALAKTLKSTREATVLVTNPDHFAIGLKYESGMLAPMVVAKGIDNIAQKMKEVARDLDIPIVENKPLARTLYKLVEVGHPIPEGLYLAVSEVIKYVYWLKGIPLGNRTKTEGKSR